MNQHYVDFLSRLRGLPAPLDSSPHWALRCKALQEFAETKDVEDFLIWSNDVSIEEYDSTFRYWYGLMKRDPEWERWHRLMRRGPAKDHPFSLDPNASPVTVQHAYHLYLYEKWTSDRFIDGVDTIVEVGGGYGNFARMVYDDGFAGKYIIVDLPHIREVQRLHIELRGGNDRIQLLTSEDLPLALHGSERVAFVATWSLSESPLEFRNKLFPSLHRNCIKYLMATQWDQPWFGIDNNEYFKNFMRDAGGDWIENRIPPRMDGGRYLFRGPLYTRKPTSTSAVVELGGGDRMKWDVVYYDTISHPFSRKMNAEKPCGGTELNHVKIVHGLAAAGFTVLVLNNNDSLEVDGGVVYDHFEHADVDCRTLVACRFSDLPLVMNEDGIKLTGPDSSALRSTIRADRIVMAMNDQFQEFQRPKYIPGSTVVLNSPWHAANFPADWTKTIVPALVDDKVYDLPPLPKDRNRFVYASAVCKGLRPTLQLWKQIKALPGMENAELHVTTAGHDRLPAEIIEAHGARWIGEKTPDEVLEELRTAAGLFFVNVLPETFCVLAAVAEAVGCRCHVLSLAGGAISTTVRQPYVTSDRDEFVRRFTEIYRSGRMPEVTPHNFSTSHVIEQWIDALGLREIQIVEPKSAGSVYETYERRAKELRNRTDLEGLLEYADQCRLALMPERALEAYKKIIARDPENERACIEAARLSIQLSLEDEETVPLVVAAAKHSDEAIEFVRTYRERHNWQAMYVAARAGICGGIESWEWHDELGIACYWLEKYEEGKEIYEQLLPKDIVPESERMRVETNYNFCLDALKLPFYKRDTPKPLEAIVEADAKPPGFGSGYPQHLIGVYKKAVSVELCDQLLSIFEAARACEITHRLDFEWRRCTILHIPHAGMTASEKVRDRFVEAIRPFVDEYKRTFGPSAVVNSATYMETPSIILYERKESQELFKEHGDNWDLGSSTRQLSIILYLNDVYVGGDTVFTKLGLRVPPREGTLLIFPSFFTHIHSAEPPISGEKFCVVTWLHFPGGQYASFPF